MKIPRDEALIGTDALQAFMEQWGDMSVPYNRLVLEIFLEELFGVSSETTTNETTNT